MCRVALETACASDAGWTSYDEMGEEVPLSHEVGLNVWLELEAPPTTTTLSRE